MFEYNYSKLANAVIRQAACDYLHSNDSMELKEIESFFLSEWFAELTTVDGELFSSELKRKKANAIKPKSYSIKLMDILA